MMDAVRGVNLILAQYKHISEWKPMVSDFVIWHGWFFSHWYGIVNGVNNDKVIIVKEGLPSLLFVLSDGDYVKNSIEVSVSKIRSSVHGEYHILQEGVWFI
jgi:hypothetical protein